MVFGSLFGEEKKDAPVVVKEEVVIKKEEPKSVRSVPFGLGTPPPTTETPTVTVTTTSAPPPEPIPQLKSPGRFDELNRESKDIIGTNECFDGLKCDFAKSLSEVFQIAHSIGLGSSQEPANYNFAASFAGGVDPVTMHPRTIWTGRIDTDGHLHGRVFHYLTPKLQVRLVGQTGNEPHSSGFSTELEYEGSDWFGQLKWINPGTYGISYHQAVTRHLSLGCDLFYKHQQALSFSSVGLRYNTDKWVGTGVFNVMTQSISYTRKVSDKVGLSTELTLQEGQSGSKESLWSLGMEYRLRMSMFKGHIDSSGKVAGYLEEVLNPNTKFLLSAELDHKKKQYKFGLGFSLNI